MKIRLVIDRLALDGIDLSPVERRRFVSALHASLEGALKERLVALDARRIDGGRVGTERSVLSLPRVVGGAAIGSALGEVLGATVTRNAGTVSTRERR